METRMDGLEDEIDGASDVVEDLSDECSDQAFRDGLPVVLSVRNDHDGKIYRALCVKGDRANLKSDSMQLFVRNHAELIEEEKAHFFDNRDTRFYYKFDD